MSTPIHDNQRQQKKTFDLPRHTLRCLRYLAERCDGAHRRDGRGFGKTDTSLGRSLAQFARLSPRQTIIGAKLVSKYPSQLAYGGLRPPTPKEIAVYTAAHRQEVEATKKKPPEDESPEQDLEPPEWWYE